MGISGLDLLIRHPLVETYFYSLKQALEEKGAKHCRLAGQ
jgi:hypothetical protein